METFEQARNRVFKGIAGRPRTSRTELLRRMVVREQRRRRAIERDEARSA